MHMQIYKKNVGPGFEKKTFFTKRRGKIDAEKVRFRI